MAGESAPLITLLSDFGNDDPWVGSLKSVLWGIQPACRIVDVTHSIPPHDVFAGAFALYRSYRDYPAWTVHLCVVDPGVGGARRPILVVTEDRYFIGPDNGLFSFIYQFDDVSRVVHITADHYFRRPLSDTFHGRDVFAPIAVWSVFANLLTWPLVGLMFLAEYLVRCRVLPPEDRGGIFAAIGAYRENSQLRARQRAQERARQSQADAAKQS